jgi:hypothetical protein
VCICRERDRAPKTLSPTSQPSVPSPTTRKPATYGRPVGMVCAAESRLAVRKCREDGGEVDDVSQTLRRDVGWVGFLAFQRSPPSGCCHMFVTTHHPTTNRQAGKLVVLLEAGKKKQKEEEAKGRQTTVGRGEVEEFPLCPIWRSPLVGICDSHKLETCISFFPRRALGPETRC